MRITGAQAIVKALEMENVTHVFGYPGAAICPFYDALIDSGIKHVLTRHEQGAAHAASGYARATGKTGVCIATSGPGATNLITGIATAYMDSIPVVAITGQVPTSLIGRDVFQEADITGATAPFCKHNYLVKNVEDLPRVLKEAFHIAPTGRPGPVLVDVPIDVQTCELFFKYPKEVNIRGYKPNYKGHPLQVKKLAEAINKAKAPVICAGGGVISSRAQDELLGLAEKCDIPVVTTLMGIGSIPTEHERCLGMLGFHGSYLANHAIRNADLVIIIGARVGDRAMASARKIAEKARIVHMDIDPAEIGKNIEVHIPIVGDVKTILRDLLQIVEKGDTREWLQKIGQARQEREARVEARTEANPAETGAGGQAGSNAAIKPGFLLKTLSRLMKEDVIITTEVGQNQIWAANNMIMRRPGKFITSGGLGTMGYGLPAAVGAKTGCPSAQVINISGDGSFQMSMQELGTIKQYKLGVKIVILNNRRLGMVRELQKMKYGGRYSQVFLEDNPDFIKLAAAYGIKGERITRNEEVEGALKRMLADDSAYLLDCAIDPDEPTL
ncbi:MAG: biosynthetic-type acetolactate synthase large subunit [Clostridiaceae bacterium]|nr:biosynthetic-type acetolactate synthase large subunit [Clostridiaceae bacterium]